MKKQKTISYQTINTYHTLSKLTAKTQNIWLAFHGYGELSEKFSKHFELVNLETNYIIVFQAPAKFYLGNDFNHIGASWLTKENHDIEIKNTLHYVDAVMNQELQNYKTITINTLGFSQGVSIMMRWLSYSKQKVNKVVLWAGILPKELHKEDYTSLSTSKILSVVGNQDHFVTPDIAIEQFSKLTQYFNNHTPITYTGVHRIKRKLLHEIMESE
ncbi:hypothetical protein UJ101_00114 [Flavobacteriaceae bacterium UJ101]|nr:hypothetical protein UJ101_00114 [Flavobacteriaceae bacterium UJ101]